VAAVDAASCASARRGLARIAAGTPLARARRPMRRAPKSILRMASRRLRLMLCSDHSPTLTTQGEMQARVNVDLSATVGVFPKVVAAL